MINKLPIKDTKEVFLQNDELYEILFVKPIKKLGSFFGK